MYLYVFFQTDVLPFSYRLGGLKRLHESFSSWQTGISGDPPLPVWNFLRGIADITMKNL